VERKIVSFHCDLDGDWVAHLDCGHRQHVRHRPPFQHRAWVHDEAGRAARIGHPLDCPLCDRGELPDGLRPLRSMTWDEATLPAALRKEHRLGPSTWGLLHVLSGNVRLLRGDASSAATLVQEGSSEGIPPGAPHRLEPAGHVRLTLRLYEVGTALGDDSKGSVQA